jgi:hypothetical protein
MPSAPSGTLMMYVGCPSYYDDVGRGVLTAEREREVLEKTAPDRFFARLVDGYLESSGNYGTRVGNAITHLIPARDLYSFAGPLMQETARSEDP